jgi:hypothetical protein
MQTHSLTSPGNRRFQRAAMPIDGWRAWLFGQLCQSARRLVQGLPRLAPLPERMRHSERGNSARVPPRYLLARAMHLARVDTAEWHRIFIADLPAERARLRKRQMMRVGGLLGAN